MDSFQTARTGPAGVMFSRSTARWVVIATMVIAGCRKPDPVIAEYSSAGSGRPDGGWVFRFYASGECEAYAVNGSLDTVGTYNTNHAGYQLEIQVRPAWKRLLMSERGPRKFTLVSVKTNGTEYLMDEFRYKTFAKTGDTNMLRQESRRIH